MGAVPAAFTVLYSSTRRRECGIGHRLSPKLVCTSSVSSVNAIVTDGGIEEMRVETVVTAASLGVEPALGAPRVFSVHIAHDHHRSDESRSSCRAIISMICVETQR